MKIKINLIIHSIKHWSISNRNKIVKKNKLSNLTESKN